MIPDAIAAHIKEGNLAQVMRGCLALLDELHPTDQPVAFRQNVLLRGHVDALYKSQSFALGAPMPISPACIAGAAYDMLSDGKSVATIMTIPEVDMLRMAADLAVKHVSPAYNPFYTRNKRSIDSTYHEEKIETSERGGDAAQPAPSGRDAGFIEYYRDPPWRMPEQSAPSGDGGYVTSDGLAHLDHGYLLPRHEVEEYERKHPRLTGAETVNITIGPISINPDDHQKLQDEIARRQRESRSLHMEFGGSGSKRFNPPADGSAMTLEHFRSVDPPPQVRTKLVVSGRSVFFDFGDAPNHESALARWITLRLYAMLAFQTIKGWYRIKPKDGEK